MGSDSGQAWVGGDSSFQFKDYLRGVKSRNSKIEGPSVVSRSFRRT